MTDFGGFDPRMFENVPLFRELSKVLSWSGGPVNYQIAGETARSVVAARPALGPAGDRDAEAFAQAVGVAELWLDQITRVPRVDGQVRAFTPSRWVDEAVSSQGLGGYVEPLAAGMGETLGADLPEQLRPMAGQLGQAMNAFGAMLYGVQLGTIAGHLAGQLLSVYDLGFPTVDVGIVGTVGATAERFARDYEFDETEFRYWLALREAAQRRLWAGVPWLRPRLVALTRRFAEESELDPGALLEGLGGAGFDPSDPASVERALEGPDAFRVEPNRAQRAVLDQLQALVALVQGWTETAVAAAAGDKLPSLPRVQEAMRRRRAEKGPGEQFLQQLIGLDLQPADVRAGIRFCDAVAAARGRETVDLIWVDEDLLPVPEEVADASRWLLRLAGREIESEIGGSDPGPGDPPRA